MQVPRRRGDFRGYRPDPHLTEEKYNELKAKLEHLKKVSRLRAMKEVATLAEQGDFSENAGYQIAKGRLRGINQHILELEEHLKQAVIIRPAAGDRADVGSRVIVEAEGKTREYLILGSSETDPTRGIISRNSPLGAALIGKRAGESIGLKQKTKVVTYYLREVKN